MTEGYQPPTARGSANADQDTTTLPRLSAPSNQGSANSAPPQNSAPQNSAPPAGWPPPARPDAGRPVTASGDDAGGSGLGARFAAAANSAAATATTAATNAKGAMRTAANEAENKSTRPARGGRGARQPRRARLTLSHINVYSVFKFSCVLAIALFFVWLIMVGVLYGILDVSGVFSKINDTVHTISGDGKTNDVVTGSLVFGSAIIIGVVNIVLFIALSTIGAMIYNLCADLVGGAEVTLSERE
ncbi:MAG: DUF3566 domain-containing protein [Jatrophihabitans sp.]